MHQHGRDRATAAIELRLDHRAFGRTVRIGLQVENFGLQPNRLQQPVEVDLLGGRHLDVENIAAEQFDLYFVLQQFGRAPGPACASGLSILLMATIDRHLAALACWIASTVCGITPSSAATTSTTMSVTLAPRARIAVKASWPGVSMKVIFAPSGEVT